MVFCWLLIHSERFGDVLGICFLSHARVIKTTETWEKLLETWTFTVVGPAAAVGNKVNRVLWQRRMWEESRERLKYKNESLFATLVKYPLEPGIPRKTSGGNFSVSCSAKLFCARFCICVTLFQIFSRCHKILFRSLLVRHIVRRKTWKSPCLANVFLEITKTWHDSKKLSTGVLVFFWL